MKIQILIVGKLKNPALVNLEQDFLKRLKKFARIDVTVIKGESVPDERRKEAKEKEGERIIKALKNEQNDVVIAMDNRGDQFTSEGFAEFIEKRKDLGENLIFIIGGPFGLSQEVRKKADIIMSLSEMTFLHEIAYVLLLEQLYRGLSINAGSQYHK
jgi:23S rRNA (pseudouridine1915-N3)-methyltransferase